MSRSTICLSMIVKNEEKDIKRCLESVIPFIDYWVISDTGSTDKTKNIIQETMDRHGVPGELHDHEWVDFSTNRNYVLDLSREHADFIWVMDADDNFAPNGSDPFSLLDAEDKLVHMNYIFEDGVSFNRACILSSKEDMKFTGVLHEVITNADGTTVEGDQRRIIPGLGHIVARASPLKRNDTEKEKYLNDAMILEKDLEANPDNYRSMFYLGQSYQLAGALKEAIKAYSLRALFPNEGFKDEAYLAKYEIAKIKIHLGYPEEECINCCIEAWEACSTRIEPITLVMNYLYQRGRIGYALALGMMAVRTVNPQPTAPKLESSVYEYKFPDIYALCRFQCGERKEALKSLEDLVAKYEGDESKGEAIRILQGTIDTFKEIMQEDE